MKVFGMGDGFGYTQSRKSNSMKDVVGDVHGISGEKKNPVEPSDQSHSGVIDAENHQFSNLEYPTLVEDFPRDAHTGVISNFNLADPIPELSLFPQQILRF